MTDIERQLRKNFILVAVVSIVVIFLVSNLGLTIFFRNYVKISNTNDDQKIVNYLQDYYAVNNEAFENYNIMPLAKQEGVEIRLLNTSGVVIIDTLNNENMGMHRYGRVTEAEAGTGTGIASRNVEDLQYNEYPLTYEGKKIGNIQIGREKSMFSSSEDKNFFLTMNLLFAGALFIALLLAIIISRNVSGNFLKPLMTVKNNIESIASGNLNFTPIDCKTKEIVELYKVTEDLAHTLRNQEKLRRRLSSDMAHELRTPLATLRSTLEAMIDGVWETTPERLSYCNDEIIRLTRLISNLTDLFGIESENLKLHKVMLNLSDIIVRTADSFQPMFYSKNIELKLNVEKNVELFGDPDRLNQIFVNLLSNAYKYTEGNGEVEIKLYEEKEKVIVEIKDTGRGIAEEDLPCIFERFYRGDLSRNRESGGSGIGLTITKALIEAHKGIIEVDSKLGEGTTFRLALPKKEY
ncbi:MAG: ATP-binding protein [Eubacteriales bacterium]